ncbi:MAG: J domain-containing protein [Deltaproteobacteria bacterium]|nr:J domain-containing protein [Deltaproteobacteria bacterium]
MAQLISLPRENEVLGACRVLFGSQVVLSRDFLATLQTSGVRGAYLTQAKTTHPDRFPGADFAVLQRQAERFRQVAGAYDILNDFLIAREQGAWFTGTVSGGGNYCQASRGSFSGARSQERPQKRPRKKEFSPPGFTLPRRPLPLGLYLNYRGLISHTELARALVWQRQQRPRLGELSRRWGRLNEFEVREILQTRRQGGNRFGEKAVNLGLLSQFQVDTMIYFQRSRQRPLGEYFVEQGLLSAVLLEKLVSDQHDHNEQTLLEIPLLRRFLGIFF